MVIFGSGKTAFCVRDMALNKSHRLTFSNIITNKLSNVRTIDSRMIVNKEQVDTKKKKSGELEPVYEFKLNKDFWKQTQEKEGAINVIIDEAHTIINSRRANCISRSSV